ncbi:MAG: aconitase X [Candidatus Wukongarchaeota archaeon]|nr:aconitase X [Candidatus Wukongarchaeota archaeon]MDO8128423.1 aconitase X [Candidatus Wukongarchaeota archaeon]
MTDNNDEETGDVLETEKAIRWLDGVDIQTGIITQEDHPLEGVSMAGKTLIMPKSAGSTVGTYRLFALIKNRKAPKKIVLKEYDAITLPAILFGVEVEITRTCKKNERGVYVDEADVLGLPSEFLDYLKKEAELAGSERLVPVTSAQISGVSYKTITDAGLDFIQSFVEKGYKVRVLTTLNPAGMDFDEWKTMGVPENFAVKQKRIAKAFLKLGVTPTFTCTPYLCGNVPMFGDHIAWAESSAVIFANSVLGARTEREGSAKSLIAAICGLTSMCGAHLMENRIPTHIINLDFMPKTLNEYSLIGMFIGEKFGSGQQRCTPYLRFKSKKLTLDQLKALGAGLATSGSISVYHVENVTPEAKTSLITPENAEETFKCSKEEIKAIMKKLTTTGEKPDLITLGCPHASITEISEIAETLKEKRLKIPLWVCTSKPVKEIAKRQGFERIIKRSGGLIVADTCMVVAPLEMMGYKIIGTNSSKAAHYLKSLSGLDVVIASLKELIEIAT